MKASSGFLCLLLVLAAVATAHAATVASLTEANFDEFVTTHDISLVKFTAPWCGHCQELKPNFEKAAEQLEGKVHFADVDCTVEKALAQRFAVKGYPTMFVFRKDEPEPMPYTGERKYYNIVHYMKAQMNPPVRKVTTAEELAAIKEEGDTMLLVTSNYKSEMALAMAEIAPTLRDKVHFVMTKEASVAPSNAMESATLYRKDGEETFAGKATADELRDFVKTALVPLFGEINSDTYKVYMEVPALPLGWLFLTPDASEVLRNAMPALAAKYRSSILFCWIDAEKFGGVGQQLGLPEGVKYPAFVINYQTTNQHFVLPVDQEVTEETIATFVDQHLRGEVAQTFLSEEVPAPEVTAGLTTIVHSTFPKYLEMKKPMMILFYAPWCTHCKEFHPIFEELAASMEKDDIIIAKIDATKNDFNRDIFAVDGFPTVYYVPAGGEQVPETYKGDRTLAAMTEFIKSHSDNDGADL